MTEDLIAQLEARLGPLHARERLKLEDEYEKQVFHRGRHVFHFENWYSTHGLLFCAGTGDPGGHSSGG